MVTLRLAAAAAFALSAAACVENSQMTPMEASTPPPADLILTGGVIYTMDHALPRAEAVAVRGQRIVAVGSAASVRRWAGASTRVIDLAGRAVTPGLVDGHCHLYGLGNAGEMLALRGLKSAGEAA